jgi:hypothetical protein
VGFNSAFKGLTKSLFAHTVSVQNSVAFFAKVVKM